MKSKNYLFTFLTVSLIISACGRNNAPLAMNPQPQLNSVNTNNPAVEANGWFDRRINKIIIDVMGKYDHNLDGNINFRETNTYFKTIINKNENIRQVRRFSDKELLVHSYSLSKLFLAADTNKDGVATQDEINSFISKTYDLNNDGLLQSRGLKFWKDKDEYQIFKDEVGEEYKSTTRLDLGQPGTPNNNINWNIDLN